MWRLALSVVAGVVHGFSMAWPAFALGDVLGVTGQSSGFLQCFSLGILAAILLQLASQDAQPKSFIASNQAQPKTKRQGQSVWRQGALIGAVFATSAMVCVDAQIWRLAILACCLGRVAACSGLVTLFCGGRRRLGGLVSPVYFVGPIDRRAVRHTG
jgi:hypothetical protein